MYHHHVQVALHLPPRSLLGNFYTVVYHPDPIVWWQIRCGKRLFWSRFYTKCINLPRQAQDKPGEDSKQERRFSQGRCQAIRKLTTAAAARSLHYPHHHSSVIIIVVIGKSRRRRRSSSRSEEMSFGNLKKTVKVHVNVSFLRGDDTRGETTTTVQQPHDDSKESAR